MTEVEQLRSDVAALSAGRATVRLRTADGYSADKLRCNEAADPTPVTGSPGLEENVT